jgi:uncharacterized protein YggE
MESPFSEERTYQIGIGLVAVLATLALFLLVATFRAFDDPQPPVNTITVEGEGRAFAVPDTATFTYTVTEEASSVAAAQDSANKRISAILNVLEESGIQEEDIKTVSYNVSPRYEFRDEIGQGVSGREGIEIFPYPEGNRVLVGYEVSQTNEVRVRDTQTAGELLTQIGGSGADYVSGLSFTIWDSKEVEAEAREMAIDDARAKAGLLARQLDVDLGKVTSFSESKGGYPIPMYARAESDMALGGQAAPADISIGQNEINSYVTITYEID